MRAPTERERELWRQFDNATDEKEKSKLIEEIQNGVPPVLVRPYGYMAYMVV